LHALSFSSKWWLTLAAEVAVEKRRAALLAENEAIWIVPENEIARVAVARIADLWMKRSDGPIPRCRRVGRCSPHLVSPHSCSLQASGHSHISIVFSYLYSKKGIVTLPDQSI
jgi:hypothetical protein